MEIQTNDRIAIRTGLRNIESGLAVFFIGMTFSNNPRIPNIHNPNDIPILGMIFLWAPLGSLWIYYGARALSRHEIFFSSIQTIAEYVCLGTFLWNSYTLIYLNYQDRLSEIKDISLAVSLLFFCTSMILIKLAIDGTKQLCERYEFHELDEKVQTAQRAYRQSIAALLIFIGLIFVIPPILRHVPNYTLPGDFSIGAIVYVVSLFIVLLCIVRFFAKADRLLKQTAEAFM